MEAEQPVIKGKRGRKSSSEKKRSDSDVVMKERKRVRVRKEPTPATVAEEAQPKRTHKAPTRYVPETAKTAAPTTGIRKGRPAAKTSTTTQRRRRVTAKPKAVTLKPIAFPSPPSLKKLQTFLDEQRKSSSGKPTPPPAAAIKADVADLIRQLEGVQIIGEVKRKQSPLAKLQRHQQANKIYKTQIPKLDKIYKVSNSTINTYSTLINRINQTIDTDPKKWLANLKAINITKKDIDTLNTLPDIAEMIEEYTAQSEYLMDVYSQEEAIFAGLHTKLSEQYNKYNSTNLSIQENMYYLTYYKNRMEEIAALLLEIRGEKVTLEKQMKLFQHTVLPTLTVIQAEADEITSAYKAAFDKLKTAKVQDKAALDDLTALFGKL